VLKVGAVGPWAILLAYAASSLVTSPSEQYDVHIGFVVYGFAFVFVFLFFMLVWPFARLERRSFNDDPGRWNTLACTCIVCFGLLIYLCVTGNNESNALGWFFLVLASYLYYLATRYFRLLSPDASWWMVFPIFLALFILPIGSFFLARMAPSSPKECRPAPEDGLSDTLGPG